MDVGKYYDCVCSTILCLSLKDRNIEAQLLF